MTINSLPDKYRQEKVRAMEDREVISSGRLSEERIRPVESSLVSVLAHPYTQSALISEWLGPVQERFFAHQCQTYNDVPCRLLTHIISSAYCLCCWIRLTGTAPP